MPRGRPKKTNDDVLLKSAEMIGWAIGGIEREILQTRERLATLTAQATKLRARIGIAAPKGTARGAQAAEVEAPPIEGRKRRRRSMSPEARKRMSEMMKKRWAERRKGK